MQKQINHNWFYPVSPKTVWEYLTQPELLSAWLMKNDIKPVVGHQFTFETRPLPAMAFDGIVYCEILEAVPFEKLSYSWKGGSGDGRITLDSVVTWTLRPQGSGTELLLEHTGFEETEGTPMFIGMDAGWKKNMSEKLHQLLEKSYKHEATGS